MASEDFLVIVDSPVGLSIFEHLLPFPSGPAAPGSAQRDTIGTNPGDSALQATGFLAYGLLNHSLHCSLTHPREDRYEHQAPGLDTHHRRG